MAQALKLDMKQLLQSSLFDVLGLNGLPEAEQDELRLMVMESIRDRVLVRIVDILGPTREKQWFELLDQSDDAAVQGFLTDNGIDVDQLALEEAIRYKIDLATRLNIMKVA